MLDASIKYSSNPSIFDEAISPPTSRQVLALNFLQEVIPKTGKLEVLEGCLHPFQAFFQSQGIYCICGTLWHIVGIFRWRFSRIAVNLGRQVYNVVER